MLYVLCVFNFTKEPPVCRGEKQKTEMHVQKRREKRNKSGRTEQKNKEEKRKAETHATGKSEKNRN